MTIDEVVYLLQLREPKNLAPVQELLLRRAWMGETYASMAKTSHYEADYLRNAASLLWRLLSETFEEPINKVNFRSKLEPLPFPTDQQKSVEKLKDSLPIPITSFEFPSGPVPLDSPFYIERPPIEGLALSQISKPGSIVRIKAPGKMGKSSLMLRIAAHATAQGYQTVILDFLQAEEAVFASLETFLRWFCTNISWQLKLEPRIDDYWHASIGSKVSCSIYLQGYLLEQINAPLVLALNEVNTVFEHPQIAQDFLPLLRSWHEESKHIESLQKLRLVVVHSTEVYIPLDLNQSPFNVGLCLKLLPLSLEQIEDLAARHGLNWTDDSQARKLREMVGGHPYLVRLALYHLCSKQLTLEQLLQAAPTLNGIYSDHLRSLWKILQGKQKLATTFKQLVTTKKSLQLDPVVTYKLESMGLVKLDGNEAKPSCNLYRLYFAKQLDF